jgi:hypothetical protein
MEKKYKLFTSSRCAPCIMVKNHLDRRFKEWGNFVEIIDVTGISREDWIRMKEKYKIPFTPTLIDINTGNIVFSNYWPSEVDKFIESISQAS